MQDAKLSTDAVNNNFTQTLATQNETAQSQKATANNLKAQSQVLTTQYNTQGIDYTSCVTYAFQESQEYFANENPQACFLSYIESFNPILLNIYYQIFNFQDSIVSLITLASGCFNPICALAIGSSIAALILQLDLFLGTILVGLIAQLGLLIDGLLICYVGAIGETYLNGYQIFFDCLLGLGLP